MIKSYGFKRRGKIILLKGTSKQDALNREYKRNLSAWLKKPFKPDYNPADLTEQERRILNFLKNPIIFPLSIT